MSSLPWTPEYLPFSQSTQVDSEFAAVWVENLPIMQFIHSDSEAIPGVSEYVPALHKSHCASFLASVSEYFPVSQSEHDATPTAKACTENVPRTHDIQAADSDTEPTTFSKEYFPDTQCWHAVSLLLPATVEYFATPQLMHTKEGGAMYFPAAQSSHVDADEAPCTAENFPAPHNTQALGWLFPDCCAYVPIPQSTQLLTLSEPDMVEKEPATHLTHVAGEFAPMRLE